MLLAARSSASSAQGIALSVDPMVFEFSAPYGGEDRAQVSVSNPGSLPEYVQAHAIDWDVRADGSIALLRANAIAHTLAPYLRVSPEAFTLAPGETRTVVVSVRLSKTPSRPLSAMWSGFLLLASAAPGGGGITPGATIVVYDSTQPRHPELELRFLQAMRQPQPHLVAHILNASRTYVRPTAHVLFKRGSRVLRDDALPMNAVLPGGDRWLSAPIPHFPRGRYEAELVVDYGPAVLDGTTHVDIP